MCKSFILVFCGPLADQVGYWIRAGWEPGPPHARNSPRRSELARQRAGNQNACLTDRPVDPRPRLDVELAGKPGWNRDPIPSCDCGNHDFEYSQGSCLVKEPFGSNL
jgi:hypothetical protein